MYTYDLNNQVLRYFKNLQDVRLNLSNLSRRQIDWAWSVMAVPILTSKSPDMQAEKKICVNLAQFRVNPKQIRYKSRYI